MRAVSTTGGSVDGVLRDGVSAWLGLPYAAAPVGALRFCAPQPVVPWSGVRPAHRFAGAATQSTSLTSRAKPLGAAVGEDCLYLNVYSPAADDGRRPVLIWIHGGAYTSGSGALYSGGHLAALGDIVVVTVNYRLGIFGFVDLASAIDAEVPANLGIRDQVAALEWVRENIGAFGGDPDRVTVAGESAGSVSVSLLLCAPSARGLFRSAIMESGSYSLVHGEQVRTEVAARYIVELGLTSGDGSALWELPAARLLAAQEVVDKAFPGTVAAAPWFDGELVPGSLAKAQAAVRPEVAVLAGTNHDEVTLFQRLPGDIVPWQRRAIEARLRVAMGDTQTTDLLGRYPDTGEGNRALGTDFNFGMATLHFAERHVTAGGHAYYYRFDAAVPLLGATHAAELAYLWDWKGIPAFVLRGFPTAARQSHWVSFVRDGEPGADWPAFELPERATKIFDPTGDRVASDPSSYRRAGWGGMDVMARA